MPFLFTSHFFCSFFKATATTEIYTLSLHDALPISPLPIDFLPARTNSCLYIPLLGWAVFAAALFTNVADSLAAMVKPRRAVFAAIVAVGVVLLARITIREKRKQRDAIESHGRQTAQVLAEFRTANPRDLPSVRFDGVA